MFTSIEFLLTVRPLNTLFNQIPCNLGRCQAASGVSSSYDALLGLFEHLGNSLNRLQIYLRIPPTQMMMDIIVKLMVQVLSVLALGTKQIKEGRISRCSITYILLMAQCVIELFFKKMIGDNEVEVALQKLDQLTQDEVWMAIAETWDAARDLKEGMQHLQDLLLIFV